jgi:50S ribosomal protein L16 3-hydroxylase
MAAETSKWMPVDEKHTATNCATTEKVEESKRPGLLSLIDPIAPEQFISEYWCVRPLKLQKPVSSLQGFFKSLLDMKIKDMLRYAEDPVIVMHMTTDGRYRGSTVTRSQAFHFLESGMALYFNLSSFFENTREWTNSLASDLGQLQSRCKASLFITPANWTTEQHFDPNENFTIQLRGHKRWNIAPNQSVRHAVDRFTCSDAAIPPRMSTYYFYKKLAPPNNSCGEEMGPGSMLYLPRGHWHSVESLTESVSLNFCVVPETWASFLTPVLERLLITSPELREVITGAVGPAPLRKAAFKQLRDILPLISRLIAHLRPEQIFPEIADPPGPLSLTPDTPIRRNRLATLVCDPDGEKATITLHNFIGSMSAFAFSGSQPYAASSVSSKTVPLTHEQLIVLEWMMAQDIFTLQRLESHFGYLPPEMEDFLINLIKTELFYV